MAHTKRLGLGLALGMIALGVAACGGGGSGGGGSAADIAADVAYSSRGDAAAGAQVFEANCTSCHSPGTDQLVGPGLAGMFSEEGPTLPAGVSYGLNLSNGKARTETNVAEWIKTGGQGKIGLMTAQTLDDQQMADVIAYLRSLKK